MAESLGDFVFGLAFGAPDVRNLRKAEKSFSDVEKKREKQVRDTERRIARLRDQLRTTQDRDERKQLQRQMTNLRKFEKRAKDAYRAVAKEAREAGKAADKAAARRERATRDLRRGFSTGANRVAGAVLGVGLAAGGGLAALTKQVAENGAELQRWANTMGVSVESLSALQEGFTLARVPADNTREAIKTLRENLGELARVGTGPAKDSLGSLGLELEDLDGLDAEEQMAVLADAIRDVEDPAKQLSIAIELMGEDGRHLLPVLREGSDAVMGLGDAARDAGSVMTADLVDATVELDKNLVGLRGELKGASNDIASEVVPALNEWFTENEELIEQDIAGMTRNISDAIQALLPFLTTLTKGFRLASEAASGLTLVGETLAFQFEQWSEGNFIGDSEAFDIVARRRVERNQRAATDRADRAAARAAEKAELDAARPAINDARRTAGKARRRAASVFEITELANQSGGRRRAKQLAKQRGITLSKAELDAIKSGGRGGRGRKEEIEFQAEDFEADDLFGEELRRLAANSGVGEVAVTSAIKAAGKEIQRGSASSVARKAALRELGNRAGQDFTKTNGDPLLSEIFGENVPDVELSKIARGATPQTLVSNINNTFNFNIDQDIKSGGSPAEVAKQVVTGIKTEFQDGIEKSTKTATVKFVR